jgi:hypothetical protein
LPRRGGAPDAVEMSDRLEAGRRNHGPSVGVLLLCALVLAGGYGVSLLRGPKPAQEVRVVTFAPPEPAPEVVAEPE